MEASCNSPDTWLAYN